MQTVYLVFEESQTIADFPELHAFVEEADANYACKILNFFKAGDYMVIAIKIHESLEVI